MNHPDNYKEAYEQMVGLFTALKRKYKDCRNELCLKCENYREAHNGACDGCRWRADNG